MKLCSARTKDLFGHSESETTLAASPWPKYQGGTGNEGRTASGTSIPGAVSNLVAQVASPGGTVVHLTWDSAPLAWNYEVWRGVSDNFSNAERLAVNVSNPLKFDDDLARGGTNYTYWVRGVNAAGNGSLSTPVTASQTNQLWAVALGNVGTAAPVVGTNGTVYVVSSPSGRNGELAAYSPEGARLWVFETAGWPGRSPVIAPNGNIITTEASGGCIYAVNPEGRMVWRTCLGERIYSSLAVDAYGTSYVCTYTGSPMFDLYAISVDGVTLWRARPQGDYQDHVTIGRDGTIYAASSSALSAFEPIGTQRWKLSPPYPRRNWCPPALNGDGDLYTAVWNYAVPSFVRLAENGLVRASNVLAGVVWNTPREPAIAADGRAYFVIDYNLLLCLSTNGSLVWSNRFAVGGWGNLDAAVPAWTKREMSTSHRRATWW